MGIRYKMDGAEILKALKDKGYSSYRFRSEKLLGQRQLTQIRNGEVPNSMAVIGLLCKWLECQPGDLLEYVEDEGNATEAE